MHCSTAVIPFRYGSETAKVRRKDRNLTKRILSYEKKYDIMMITENCSEEDTYAGNERDFGHS